MVEVVEVLCDIVVVIAVLWDIVLDMVDMSSRSEVMDMVDMSSRSEVILDESMSMLEESISGAAAQMLLTSRTIAVIEIGKRITAV